MSPPLSRGTSLQAALTTSLERICRHHRAFGDQFPTIGQGTRYQVAANDNWLAGFWPGLLWLAYDATGDEDLRDHAEGLLSSFDRRLVQHIDINHDLGFLLTLSARAQRSVTGDRRARELALDAAAELLQRYRPRGRYIQAWGAVGDPEEGGWMIIDTMMNLPLLFWASEQSGDPRYHRAAFRHAETTLQYLVRRDGSTYHTFYLDQTTGHPIGPRTHQGWSHDSLWSRGQAWAIYGFALAAQWCREDRFLDTSERAADRFLAELPQGGIPWWDLRLPKDAPHYPDSSAGAIAAGGMLRLAHLVGGESGAGYRASALTLLESLVAGCLETRPAAQGLLRHGTYHAREEWGVDAYFICGDYFFLEALLAVHGRAPDFWGPTRGPDATLSRLFPERLS